MSAIQHLFGVNTVARILRCHERTVRRIAARLSLDKRRIGSHRALFFRAEEVDAMKTFRLNKERMIGKNADRVYPGGHDAARKSKL